MLGGMLRHQEPYNESSGTPIWILTDPRTLVRFDAGDYVHGQYAYNTIGATLLMGHLDNRRLRSINLNRLAYIRPRYTPLPRWVGSEPPDLTSAQNATIDVDGLVSDLEDPDAPWSQPFDDPVAAVRDLYDPWARGETNEDAAVDFLRSLWASSRPSYRTEFRDLAIANGLFLVAPMVNSPGQTLAEALYETPNYARQVIHRLRQKGYFPPALKEGSTK